MARQILPLAGQIIGGMVGGPVGAAIGGAIGSVVGNAIDPQIIKGPKLGDGQVQTSAEGVFRPIVLGTGAVMGNIIHRGPEVVRTHRQRQSKGGGPKTEEQRRYRTFAIRVAEGPIAGILRIWMDEKLVYDIRPESTIPAESAEFASRFRLYLGGEDQLPDPDIEAYLGIGNVNAYRGTAYVVFPNFDLTDYGDRIPQFRFEVVGIHDDDFLIGDDFTATRWFDATGGSRTFYSYVNSDGRINYMASEQTAQNGNQYLIGQLGVDLEDIEPPSAVTWTSGSGPSRPLAINNSGHVILNDGNGGECRLAISGQIIGNFQPIDTDNPGWWYGESWYSPEYGGLIWFRGSHVFIGIRRTGSNAWYTRRILKFPVTGGSDVPSSAIATEVGSAEPNPQFWMTMSRDGLIYVLGSDSQLTTYDESLDIVDERIYPHSIDGVAGIGVDSGTFVVVRAAGIDFRSLSDFSLIKTVQMPGDSPTGYNTRVTFSHDSCYIQRGDGIRERVFVGRIPYAHEASGVKLSTIVGFLSVRCGQSPSDFSVAQLDDDVDGIVLAGEYTGADTIRTLMPVYMFDASEHDAGGGYRISYVKRGGPVVATITADDLVDEPEESVREDALERPKKLHLHFQSPTVGYAPAKATSMRNSPDVLVTGEVSASVPVVFNDVNEAWRRAGVMHQVAWSEVAGTQELVLSDAWLELVPTDNIGLVLRDQQRRLRITKIEHVEGTLKCDLMTDRQSSYTSSLTGIPLPEPTPPPPSIVGPTVFAFLDIPALTDAGDRLLYYVGVSGQTPAWYGAVIQRSMDGGANYEDVLTVGVNTIMGTLLDPISSASEHYTDTTNVVRVQLFTDDEIQSLTQQQFLSEGGAFALEKPGGGWEVMQYRDADDEGDGVFALTTLLRGRLNSGPDEHLTGARFVLLDGVYAIDAETAMIGQELTHRAVSLGTSPELGPVSTDTYAAKSQQEWPVAHVLGEIDGGSLPVRIVPRHRFGTEDHPVRSANWTGHRLTATDGSSAATVTTTSDDHVFSVSGWSYPITVTAEQLNRFTGAGPSVSEDLE